MPGLFLRGRTTAKRQRHTPQPIIYKLRESEVKTTKGVAIAQLCKVLAVTDETPPDYPPLHSCASSAVRPSRLPPVPVIHLSALNPRTSWSPVTTTRSPS